MSESSLDATRDAGGALRWFRYLYRVPLLLLHLCLGLPVTMLCVVVPALARIRIGHDDTLEERMIRWWQGTLMRVFGFRLRRFGTPLPGATLFVANHVSWVDISILHSQRVMGFVAKREIAGWPLVGWLATKGQTIFHQRGNTESLGGVLQEMLLRLQSGKPVGVFPEGRTRGVPKWARSMRASSRQRWKPACRYSRWRCGTGCAATRRRWWPSVSASFFANIVRLLGEPSRLAEVHFLEPIRALDIEGRRRMAETSRQRIVAAMES